MKLPAVATVACLALAACAAPASPSPSSPVVVTLGIYSGRPDPAWTLTTTEAAGLDVVLAALPAGTGVPPVGGLGYHGFTITRPGTVLVAYDGAIGAPGDGPRAMTPDPTRSVERYLLETSRAHVTPEEYAEAELAISGP